MEVHDRGEKSLLEAQTLQLKLSEQSRAIETQLAELREREKHFATVRGNRSHESVFNCVYSIEEAYDWCVVCLCCRNSWH